LLAKFHQKEKLETKLLEKKWFWRFSVAKNDWIFAMGGSNLRIQGF
jgi:hypothetical protein